MGVTSKGRKMEFDIQRPLIEKSEYTVRKDLSVPLKQQDLINPGSLILIILRNEHCVSLVLAMFFRYYLMVNWFFCSSFRLSVSLTG